MFGTSGIRGRVGEEVTAELALSLGRAVGVDADRVVVGRDARESGRLLADALTAGLRESGTDVVDFGFAATPTVARSVAAESADAGAVVTASHNPSEDNGIKLWQPSGQAFDSALQDTISTRVRERTVDLQPWDALGARERRDTAEGPTDAYGRHLAALVDAVDLAESLSVVVDLGNGAGAITVDALQELGCHVETLNAQPDGSFPGRPSEPTPENCETLAATVAATDADVGIAHDGDADRMRAVAADGTYLSGDVTLALLARATANEGDSVAAPVDTSLAVDDHLAAAGVDLVRTKVGDVYVAERASEPGVAFGGEPSGAWIWPAETLCPDGPLAACKTVALASERPLADRLADIETYPIRRGSVETAHKSQVMERVRERVTDAYDDVTTLDGVRVSLGDAWFLLRASGTQPIVRITAEARDEERTEAVFAEAREHLDAAIDAVDAA